jgi:hypothetical protein
LQVLHFETETVVKSQYGATTKGEEMRALISIYQFDKKIPEKANFFLIWEL